jgi:hypothetical protein
MKPRFRLNWCQWMVGFEWWNGLIYIHIGPIELVW